MTKAPDPRRSTPPPEDVAAYFTPATPVTRRLAPLTALEAMYAYYDN